MSWAALSNETKYLGTAQTFTSTFCSTGGQECQDKVCLWSCLPSCYRLLRYFVSDASSCHVFVRSHGMLSWFVINSYVERSKHRGKNIAFKMFKTFHVTRCHVEFPQWFLFSSLNHWDHSPSRSSFRQVFLHVFHENPKIQNVRKSIPIH